MVSPKHWKSVLAEHINQIYGTKIELEVKFISFWFFMDIVNSVKTSYHSEQVTEHLIFSTIV